MAYIHNAGRSPGEKFLAEILYEGDGTIALLLYTRAPVATNWDAWAGDPKAKGAQGALNCSLGRSWRL
jgi:hypothetical protein